MSMMQWLIQALPVVTQCCASFCQGGELAAVVLVTLLGGIGC